MTPIPIPPPATLLFFFFWSLSSLLLMPFLPPPAQQAEVWHLGIPIFIHSKVSRPLGRGALWEGDAWRGALESVPG